MHLQQHKMHLQSATDVIQITGRDAAWMHLQQHKMHLQSAAAVIQLMGKGCSVDASAAT
jgi:hypothetical protein